MTDIDVRNERVIGMLLQMWQAATITVIRLEELQKDGALPEDPTLESLLASMKDIRNGFMKYAEANPIVANAIASDHIASDAEGEGE